MTGVPKGCTRSTHSGGREVVSFSFVPGDPNRYPAWCVLLSSELYNSIMALSHAVAERYGVALSMPNPSQPSQLAKFGHEEMPSELREWFCIGFFDLPLYEFLNFNESAAMIEKMDGAFDFVIDGEPAVWCDPNDAEFCRMIGSWPNQWIPIANLHESGLVFVDLDPGPKGRIGQVVHAWIDEMLLDVQGNSISDWFHRIKTTVLESERVEPFMVIPQDIRRTSPVYDGR